VIFADLVNVFEVFLPQLLLYPNPSDPLNGDAAALMMRDRPAYEQKVKGNTLCTSVCLLLPCSKLAWRFIKTFISDIESWDTMY
jgi:hypothetical protein